MKNKDKKIILEELENEKNFSVRKDIERRRAITAYRIALEAKKKKK